MTNPSRQHHDMGGQSAGAVHVTDHDLADWEKQVEAMAFLLTGVKSREFRVDEFRRHIESLPPDVYESAGYYGRWILSLTDTLIEKGILTREELDARLTRRAGGGPTA